MKQVQQLSQWCYRGIWGVLTSWFRVPADQPQLPAVGSGQVHAFRPAAGFLKYLTFQFWIALLVIDIAILIAWIAITIAVPWLGLVLAIPALIIAVVPDIIAYLAIHLRYDTTWYAFNDRSLRIRRGIWIIHETTITFENVQNVSIQQGPLQRFFGIADIHVQTAGGGGGQAEKGGSMTGHQGIIEGIDDPQKIRDLIMSQLKRSRSAGLGDEREAAVVSSQWTSEQLQVLQQIRDLLQPAP